jgi:D,D-heptose 1,7-bisphosphate phosphatase
MRKKMPFADRMKAVILVGGKGTRLGPLTETMPKPLIPVAGKPVLEHQISMLRSNGVTDIILVTGYLGNLIRDIFGDGSRYGVHIDYFREEKPLGTAGALAKLAGRLRTNFMLLYGDLVLDVDISRLIDFHLYHDALCTMMVHPSGHVYDSDVVVMDQGGVVKNILEKNKPRHSYFSNLVNAGMFVCAPEFISLVDGSGPQDLEKDVISPAIESGRVYGYKTTEYIRDMGTTERYAKAQADMQKGVVARRNLKRKQKAVFLDRDGTINKLAGLVTRPEQLVLEDDAIQAVRALNGSEYLCIVITNQSVIARGLCTVGDLEEIHRRMETLLAAGGAYIDALYYCPHHPDAGFEGEDPAYKVTCACRKPGTLLIETAAAACNIDLAASYIVGDTTADIQTGLNAGVRTVLLSRGEAGRDGKFKAVPDLRAESLQEASGLILTETYQGGTE